MASSPPVVVEHLVEEIYNGRRRLGQVVEQAPEWLASNDDNQLVGRYPTRKAAVAAVLASARAVR